MNGRVYDPRIGRFVSPDPFVQAPYFSQSYNRYAYVFNSPMSATDSSGFFGAAAGEGPEVGSGRSSTIEEVRVVGIRTVDGIVTEFSRFFFNIHLSDLLSGPVTLFGRHGAVDVQITKADIDAASYVREEVTVTARRDPSNQTRVDSGRSTSNQLVGYSALVQPRPLGLRTLER
jgi:hypothetical protein